MAGRRSDLDGVAWAVQSAGDGFDLPVRHFPDIVAAFARPATIEIDGQAALCEPLNVINVTYRCIAVRVSAHPIPEHDQLPKEPVELPAERITTDNRSSIWLGVEPAHHFRPLLLNRMSRASSVGSGP